MEYVLMGVGAWLGASLLAGAGWALVHIDVRAREARARAIRPNRHQATLATGEAPADQAAPTRQTA